MTQPTRWKMGAVQAITLSRIALAVVFGTLLICGSTYPNRMASCFVILVLIELTDGIDGFLARYWKCESVLGALLDPYSDSVSRILVFSALAHDQRVAWAVPAVMIFRDITVSYCRVVLALRGASVSARLSGKIKAVVQAGAGLIVVGVGGRPVAGESSVYTVVSWLVVIVTLASMGEYLLGAWRSLSHVSSKPDE